MKLYENKARVTWFRGLGPVDVPRDIEFNNVSDFENNIKLTYNLVKKGIPLEDTNYDFDYEFELYFEGQPYLHTFVTITYDKHKLELMVKHNDILNGLTKLYESIRIK